MPIWLAPYLNSAHPLFYPSLFGSLFLAGNGFPISADLVLITVSYLIFKGMVSFPISVVICIAGILIGDTVMYSIGRYFGEGLLQKWPLKKMFKPDGLNRAKLTYSKYGYGMVSAARFMPGIRTIFMFTSGLMNLSYWKFLLADFLGAVIVIPSLLYSVTFFAGNQEKIVEWLKKGQWFALGGFICLLTVWLLNRKKKNLQSL